MGVAAENSGVGSRIRSLRQSRGLSLRALSEDSGLSSNAISLIERGENSPTVTSLRRLATALAVPIAAFFGDSDEATVSLVKPAQRARNNMVGMRVENLSSGIVHQKLAPYLVSVAAGAGDEAESFMHQGEEFVHCLEGTFEYRVGDRIYTLEAGDSLHFNADQVHQLRNPAGTPAVAIIIIEEPTLESGEPTPAIHRSLHAKFGSA